MEAKKYFDEGNSFMADDLHDQAYEAYSKAIHLDNHNADYLIKRATCGIKMGKYDDAVADLNSVLKNDPNNALALLRKGTALYHLEEYESAKASLSKGINLLNESNLTTLKPQFTAILQKCEEKLKEDDLGISHSSTNGEGKSATTQTSAPTSTPAQNASAPSVSNTIPPTNTNNPLLQPKPKYRREWFQSQQTVSVTVFGPNIQKSKIDVNVGEKNVSISITGPDNDSYHEDIKLFHAVVPNEYKSEILPRKLEIEMKKQDNTIKWESLEEKEVPAVRKWEDTSKVDKTTYPSSSKVKRNWEQIAKEEPEEEVAGDEALNKVFRQIYANASEEQRRAMNKSFTESGGTVLSTNWEDVGARTVEGSAPQGQEIRKWNQ